MSGTERQQIQKYMATVVLINLAALSRDAIRDVLRKIAPLTDLLWILSKITNPKRVRTGLGVAFNHKDFTPDHLFALYTDKQYVDHQRMLSNAMLRQEGNGAGWLTKYLEHTDDSYDQANIIGICSQTLEGQRKLITAFFAHTLPELTPRLAEGIIRQPLIFTQIQDFMRQPNAKSSLMLFAKVAAKIPGIDVDELRWVFAQIQGYPQHELEFIDSITDQQNEIFFHILMETQFEKTRAACANIIKHSAFSSATIDYWVDVADRTNLTDAVRWLLSLLGDSYANRSTTDLLDILARLKNEDFKRPLIENILTSHVAKLREIAGIPSLS